MDRHTLARLLRVALISLLPLLLLAGCSEEKQTTEEKEGKDENLGLHPGAIDLEGVSEERTQELVWEAIGRPQNNRQRFLDVMKLSLTDLLYEDDQQGRRRRVDGWDWPGRGYTMIGLRRLRNIDHCYQTAVENGVPGDLIEAGAWRGGATIYMRALLAAHDDTERTVWVADSFEGLPKSEHPKDKGLELSEIEELAISLEEVKRNFSRYGLLDDQVRFLKGWFVDTLPDAPIERLALLRIDADLYASTTDALTHLYPKLSPGGCVIVDDYWIPACAAAVHDFIEANGIESPLQKIDTEGVFWIKGQERPTRPAADAS